MGDGSVDVCAWFLFIYLFKFCGVVGVLGYAGV